MDPTAVDSASLFHSLSRLWKGCCLHCLWAALRRCRRCLEYAVLDQAQRWQCVQLAPSLQSLPSLAFEAYLHAGPQE